MRNKNYSALIKTTIAIIMLFASACGFLSMLNLNNGHFLFAYKSFILGISGIGHFFLPILGIWFSIVLLGKNKIKTYKDYFILSCIIYFEVLALINLASNIKNNNSLQIMNFMDFISTTISNNNDNNSTFIFVKYVYNFAANSVFKGQSGGVLGLILAYPLYSIAKSTIAIIICAIVLFITVIILVLKLSYIFFPHKNIEYYQNQQNFQYPFAAQNNQQYINNTDFYGNADYRINRINNASDDIETEPITINATKTNSKKQKNIKKSLDVQSNSKYYIPDDNFQSEPIIINKTSKKQTKPRVKKNVLNQTQVQDKIDPVIINKDTHIKEIDKVEQGTFLDIVQSNESFKTEIVKNKPIPSQIPKQQNSYTNKNSAYLYPNAGLLNAPEQNIIDHSSFDKERAELLEETLTSFGINARVVKVTHGPAVTRFELDLASGINVKKISNIADNIALNMSAESGVRIESPIPGTTYVGIEIPNKTISVVSFREVLFSKQMLQEKDTLAIALGKDISGTPIICNLAKMPHLLIAGATGSGKSVCINTIINSLIFRCSPKECRLILIDPKMVELQRYNILPHLLIPVVCEPHKAAGALAWALAEMTDRYNRFKDRAVSNIETYNNTLNPGEEKLPRIVIIIDELADLMISQNKKEIENDINRIAALARAAGIHLVVATQRPSVDVITGVIKANLLSRIAFLASSGTDSRTILDRYGAENLVGNGDMLYMPSGFKNPLRVQGCFLKNEEINRVVKFIDDNSSTEFDETAIEAISRTAQDEDPEDAEDASTIDPLLEEAIEMVINDGQASISMLQRRMSIGYARAGRLIDGMARRGIVSKSQGSKPREVLMTREQFDEMRNQLLR